MSHALCSTSRFVALLAWVLVCACLTACFAACLAPTPARADASEECASSYENAQIFRMRGHYMEAREALLVCLQPSCPKLLRNDCIVWLPQVEASLPSVVFAVSNMDGNDIAGARLFADDKPLEGRLDGRAHAINPGVYKLRFEAPGYRPEEQTLTIREGEKNRMVHARLSAEQNPAAAPDGVSGVVSNGLAPVAKKPHPIPILTYALGGASLASLGVFSYFAASGHHEYKKLKHDCSPGCSEKRTESGKRDYVIADVMLGTSVAFAAAAVWSYFWKRPTQPAADVPNVSLHIDKQGAALGFGTRF